MNTFELDQLKFPIGKYKPDKNPSKVQIEDWINVIHQFPILLKKELSKTNNKDAINWKYRPNGWTVKQVVHHCADSHMNSIIRFKLALTEDKPTIRPYFEEKWAELSDSQDDNLIDVLSLLSGLHNKWVKLLKSLSASQLQREYIHPEHGKTFNLAETIGNYSWHCNHHLAHVKIGLSSLGKYN